MFSFSNASTWLELAGRSVDRFSRSKLDFRSSMSLQIEFSLVRISKSSESSELDTSEPSVSEAVRKEGAISSSISLSSATIVVSFGGFST